MTDFTVALKFVSSALLVILSVITLAKTGKKLQKAYFVATAMILACAEFSLGFLLKDTSPQFVLNHARLFIGFSIILPAAALPFFTCFGRRRGISIIKSQRISIVVLTVLLILAAIFHRPDLLIGKIHFDDSGSFWGITFTDYGRGLAIFILLSNIFYMYLVENTYKFSNIAGKVTLKYPILGMVLSTAINLIVISYILALSVININYIAVQTCGLIICSITFLYANIRYTLFEVSAEMDSKEARSVLTIIVAGFYFIALAIISYISTIMDMPHNRMIFVVPSIFVLFVIIAGVISGKFRRRVRRFLNENLYPNRYNYRKEWYNFSKLMASSSTLDGLLSNTIGSICETMMVSRGVIWIKIKGGKIDFYNAPAANIDNKSARELNKLIEGKSRVIPFKGFKALRTMNSGKEREFLNKWGWAKMISPIGGGKESFGFIALGEKHWNISYIHEDREFLATVTSQVALNLENILMEEKMMESKQMESFSKFASYVIHDLKNTVGMLSLTIENASSNIKNPDFQEDLITTLDRSVDKMKSLISSLSSIKSKKPIQMEKRNLTLLIDKKLLQLKQVADLQDVVLEFESEESVELGLDAEAINHAIENIVLNAIESTPPGGVITIGVKKIKNEKVKIFVRDTGDGFDPEYLRNHLFIPFTSTKKSGLGIGLAISKNLIEAHNGSLDIENVPEGGALVTITLPQV